MASRRLFDGAQSELGILPIVASVASIDGTASITLDDVVIAGAGVAGQRIVYGSAMLGAGPLGGFGLAQSPRLDVAPASSVTATGAITLDTVTVAGSGDVGASSVDGTGAITLDSVTVAGTGSPVVVSSGAVTLDTVTVAGAGTSTIVVTGAITLDDVTVSGVGTLVVQASGAITLGDVDVDGVGTSTITSTGAITLDDVIVDGAGAVLTAGLPGPIVGHLLCELTDATLLVCYAEAAASLSCVVVDEWDIPPVSFTR
jgi:hypothetical protein